MTFEAPHRRQLPAALQRRLLVKSAGLVAASALLPSCAVESANGPESATAASLLHELESARQHGGVPGLAARIQIDGRLLAQAATGVRASGRPERVTVADRWHIGSDTKAFTATMIMRLVDRGTLSLDDALGACFPTFAAEMEPRYRSATIKQLLSHTAGLPSLTAEPELGPFLALIRSAQGVTAQRIAIARHYLQMAPSSKVGEFQYSNLGYIIVGAAAEERTGRSWENLIRAEIFAPLRISNAGFGAPGTPGRLDEPHGHQVVDGRLVPIDPGSTEADNPAALGPAGTINITLDHWARFAQDQLDGAHGHGQLLQPVSYRALHTPVTGHYALGWGAVLGPDGSPALLAHTGSNGNWLAEIRIIVPRNAVVLIAMNTAAPDAARALEDLTVSLSKLAVEGAS